MKSKTSNTNELGNNANLLLATAADNVVKCRKPHKCDYCDEIINAGELAEYCEGKTAKYDKDDKQIGIHFWKSWIHHNNPKCLSSGDV